MRDQVDRDLYEILGVDRNATREEIKRAYRKKAREVHPDVARDDPDAETKFKELTFAYEILSDEEKRREYDLYGLDGLRRGAGVDFGGFTTLQDLIDIFFGGGFRDPFSARSYSRVSVRGRDIETSVSISLGEIVTGSEREIEVERMAKCDECDGTGMMPGTHMTVCKTCNGTGQITTRSSSFFGTILRSHTCNVCGGRGQVITEPCRKCDGEGRRRITETLKITIPPGIENGDRLLLTGRGEDGFRGGKPGDLYVNVVVKEDKRFRRMGKDLISEIDLSMVDAALGTELEIETISGTRKIGVPPGTQPGDVLKLKGEGLPARGGGKRGDILVNVNVKIPTKLSGEERRLLEALREAGRKKKKRG